MSHHLDERLRHVVDRAADQRRAVVDRDNLHPGRQARLDLADALLHPIDHVDRVLSLAHDDDARHHLAGAVQVRHAPPQIRADRHVPDVADPDRRAALARGHDDALEVGDRLRVAAAAHHVLGTAELDQPTASLGVTAPHRVDDTLDRQAVVAQPVGVHVHLILTAEAAERGHLRHAGHRLQVVAQVKVLVRPQIRQALSARAVHERVLEHPAERGRVGPEFGPCIRRQPRQHAREVLHRPRARPVGIGAVFEDHIDERVAKIGDAADRSHVRRAKQRRHDRIRDLRLDDVGAAIPPRVDDDLRVAEVGNRVERHVLERVHAGERRGGHEQQDEELVPDREVDDAVDHGFALMRLSESTKKVPEVTIRSPANEPFRHFDVIADAPPRLDQPRLEVPVAAVDEHGLAQSRVHDRIRGHDERRRDADRELHVDEHAGLERPPRVRRLEPDLQRQRRLVEDRLRRAHRRRQRMALFGRRDPRGGATADERQLVAVHVGENPHAVQIRDLVELEAAIEAEPGRDAALQHDAVHRRLHADVVHDLAALGHLPDLRVGDPQVSQPVGDPLDQLDRTSRVVRLTLRARLAIQHLEAGVVRLLRHLELGIGREERREHLVLLHDVACRDALDVADPAAHGGDDRIRPVLVGHHASGRPQQPGAGRSADHADADADRVLPLGIHLHGPVRQRARRGVAARCPVRPNCLEAHAAHRAVAGMVAAVVRVHRAGVDGCGVRARARSAGPVRPPRAAGERAGGERYSECDDGYEAAAGRRSFHRCSPPEPLDACAPPGEPPRARSCRVL